MKFIHVSNVNLGAVYESDALHRVDRQQDYEEDFEKILCLAEKEAIPFLFITGNLFSKAPALKDLKRLDERLMKLPETHIFLLSGVNDQAVDEEVRNYKFESKTTYFSGREIQRVNVPSHHVEVTGIGYHEETWNQLRFSGLYAGKKGLIQILLLPERTQGAEGEELLKIPDHFDYVGVGGKVPTLGLSGRPVYAPGLLEPEGFSDQIKHGYLLGSIERGGKRSGALKVQFIQGAKREFLTFKINASRRVTYNEVTEKIAEAVKRYGTQNFYEIVLAGEASDSLYINKDHLYDFPHVLRVIDRTSREETMKQMELEHSSDAVGRFISEMNPENGDVHPELLKKALKYGVEALLETQDQ